jgi:hypothetical protein
MDLTMMDRVGDRWEKMKGSCSTGQSPPWAVLPVEEEEELCISWSLYKIIKKDGTGIKIKKLTCSGSKLVIK